MQQLREVSVAWLLLKVAALAWGNMPLVLCVTLGLYRCHKHKNSFEVVLWCRYKLCVQNKDMPTGSKKVTQSELVNSQTISVSGMVRFRTGALPCVFTVWDLGGNSSVRYVNNDVKPVPRLHMLFLHRIWAEIKMWLNYHYMSEVTVLVHFTLFMLCNKQ